MQGIDQHNLMQHAIERGEQLRAGLVDTPGIEEIRGRGLMVGLVLDGPCAEARTALWRDHQVLTGNASDPRVLRLLPPLSITEAEIDRAVTALRTVLEMRS